MSWRQVLYLLAGLACLTPWVSAPMALLAGALFTHFLGNPFAAGAGKISGLLLKASVVGLGFGMNIHSALQVGRDGLGLTAASIGLTLGLGFLLGAYFRMSRRLSHLVASGTAICGGSAIAAVGPAVRASGQEMSVALGVVFFLNSVALLLFPLIGHLLDFSQAQFGLWCAIAVHDTSSVVGAASAYGHEALQTAVTVKLARTLWIIPLALLSGLAFRSGKRRLAFPVFILFFILAMLANSYLPLPEAVTAGIVRASRAVLVLCLFLVGSALSVESLRAVGWKPLALGLALWLTVSVLSALAILHL